MPTSFYHVSANELAPGTVLQSRFYAGYDGHLLDVARQAMDMGASAVRILLLADDLIRYSHSRMPGKPWPEVVNFQMAVREVIFERIRELEYGDRPRRIEGIFLCPDLNNAERFRAEVEKGKGVILECSTSAAPFQADMGLVNIRPDLHGDVQAELALVEQRARTYWSGNLGTDTWPEVIVNGKVDVVRKAG